MAAINLDGCIIISSPDIIEKFMKNPENAWKRSEFREIVNALAEYMEMPRGDLFVDGVPHSFYAEEEGGFYAAYILSPLNPYCMAMSDLTLGRTISFQTPKDWLRAADNGTIEPQGIRAAIKTYFNSFEREVR
ncbi:hypothetical protein [Desulfovibrio subterraneus]|uniref:Uncharacterized protein n=1 Tax=Desulfovibrio subterraneus TaxID=2718620 RepID=A0A7J0BKR4_9BACT|nr:hypothetical protein [Desulfovibrio subterraneus]GFM33725.1 hypothetical protein DSM101010T_20900 [Desulfovibrio subterraneus]